MKVRLMDTLKQTIELLLICGLKSRAEWFDYRLQVIRSGNSSSEEVDMAIKEIRAVIAGMGSFTDLTLHPVQGSGVTEDIARKRQWEIADTLDEVTNALLKNNHRTATQ